MPASYRKIDSDALSIGEILKKPVFYRVPPYQRDFAWKEEQYSTLWNDILSAFNDNKNEYFLGAVVISRTENDKRRDIVDGQQRLTAISMLFAAISQTWKTLEQDRKQIGVFFDYLGQEERRTGNIIPKIQLNEVNDPIYQKYVLGENTLTPQEKKGLVESNRLLLSAYDYFRDAIAKVIDSKGTGDKDAFLIDFEEFVSERTNVILIESGDESDAFIIFETLNDRGLDLATSDLIKNYLFSKAGSQLSQFRSSWTQTTLLVSSQNMTRFLRYFWIAEYSESQATRERDLYKLFRSKVKENNASQVINKIKEYAEYYSALSNPDHAFWNDYDNSYRDYIDALRIFKVVQYRPVAMAAMKNLKPSVVLGILRALTALSFRYTMVSSLNTGNLDSAYAKAAGGISKGSITGTETFRNSINDIYPDDERFISDLKELRFENETLARYVLSRIDSKLSQSTEYSTHEKLTLEHILPLNPDPNWTEFWDNTLAIDDFNRLLGNLTLLDRTKNRIVSNKTFREKFDLAYSTSDLQINKIINDREQWDHTAIKKRTEYLASIAKDIWRIDT